MEPANPGQHSFSREGGNGGSHLRRIFNFFSYFFSCISCFIFGLICEASPVLPYSFNDFSIREFLWFYYLSKSSIITLAFFILIISLIYYLRKKYVECDIYPSMDPYRRSNTPIAWILVFSALFYSIYFFGLGWYMSFCTIVIFVPSLAFYLGNILIYKKRVHKSFQSRVFLPVFFSTASSACLGIAYQSNVEITSLGEFTNTLYFLHLPDILPTYFGNSDLDNGIVFFSIACIVQLIQLFTFAFGKNARHRMVFHIFFPISVIFASVFSTLTLDAPQCRYGIALYALVYSLGLTNAARRLGHLSNGSNVQRYEALNFYFPSMNWAVSTIPLCSLLMPAMFKEMTFWPIVLYSATITVTWTSLSGKHKCDKIINYTISVGSSALCMAAFIFSAYGFTTGSNITGISAEVKDDYWISSIFATLTTIMASTAIIRFSKDIIGLKLDYFYKNISTYTIYYEFVGPFMLLLTVSFFLCFFNLILWMFVVIFMPVEDFAKLYLQQRLVFSCISAILITLLIITMLFIRRRVLIFAIEEAHEIGEDSYTSRFAPPGRRKPSSKIGDRQSRNGLEKYMSESEVRNLRFIGPPISPSKKSKRVSGI